MHKLKQRRCLYIVIILLPENRACVPEATIKLLDTVPDPGPGLRFVLRGHQTGLQVYQLRQQAPNLTGYIHLQTKYFNTLT